MTNDEKPIRIDSRSWTGDLPPPTYKTLPNPAARKTISELAVGPILLFILGLFLTVFINLRSGYFYGYYLAAKPQWQNNIPVTFGLLVAASIAIWLLSNFVALGKWTNRICAIIALILIGMSAFGIWDSRQAFQRAHVSAPAENWLLAEDDSCGRQHVPGSRSGKPDPGPCVHVFRVMDHNGQQLWLTGRGMAKERACVRVQKLSDDHGYVWYRRIAYYDLLPEMGQTDFSVATVKSCFDGTLMQRFAPALDDEPVPTPAPQSTAHSQTLPRDRSRG